MRPVVFAALLCRKKCVAFIVTNKSGQKSGTFCNKKSSSERRRYAER